MTESISPDVASVLLIAPKVVENLAYLTITQ